VELAAGALKVKLQYQDVLSRKDIDIVFRGATKARAEAFLVLQNPVATAQRTQIIDLAVKNRLPAISPFRRFADAGGLMAYGPNLQDFYRRSATYADKILKGAKPGDLPIEQPTKFELVINLKTAKALGLTIPQSVLIRADEIIR